MKVLVLNSGSSSVKFQVIEMDMETSPGQPARKLARGMVDRVGADAVFTAEIAGASKAAAVGARDHEQAIRLILEGLGSAVDAVGHRIVHGGDRFRRSVLITDEIVDALEDLKNLAPLHNPACLSGVRAAQNVLGPRIPMVAVFDTAFHHTLPEHAATYAIPYELTVRHRIRRYGFHGLAHRYMALRYAELLSVPSDRATIVTLHLGNGCSATAIRDGRSVDTSMGFTPLEGLVMGTRSGDLDPALVGYLAREEGVAIAEVEQWLNERSGLLGISGVSGDMRDVVRAAVEQQNPRAQLALEVFCYRARKYLGAYLAALGGAQAVVFGGGIGEHSPWIRERICQQMEWSGLVLDQERNNATVGAEARISDERARVQAYVIPADEELVIALDTVACIRR